MNPLIEVGKLGQSVWYDNIRRALIDSGDLAQKIGALPSGVTSTLGQKVEGDGLRGVTSNPTIFEKAITGSTDYDESMRRLVSEGEDCDEISEALALEHSHPAADLSNPVYGRTDKLDGYGSREVSPLRARDTEGTIAKPKRLGPTLAPPKVIIKIPATPEGLP